MSGETLPLLDFDRELSLGELLGGVNKERLQQSLAQLLGTTFGIITPAGECVVGAKPEVHAGRLALRAEMEVVGFLCVADEVGDKLAAAAALVEQLLHSGARYLMASTLHLHAIKEDYDKLQAEHAALLASEARYRDLAENLEQRVAEQVKTIESTQLQLYQAEKMASIGQLAAGVAHEINNPIGFIKSNLVTARSYVNDLGALAGLVKASKPATELLAYMQQKDIDFVLDDFQAMLDESISGAERISVIVKDLKGFSNVDQSEEGMADINGILQSICNVANIEITRNAQLNMKLGELPRTRCRPGHLGQVFLNLLLNAAKAIKEKGEITVRTSCANDRIQVQICDTGCGIPAEVIKRIFDPFFTTGDVGEGTGLGLTVCRDIVAAHDGKIEVASEVGRGTTFTILLPLAS